MPAKIRVGIDHPKPASVMGTHIHALISTWIDDNHWASRKPFSITPLYEGRNGVPTFEIGVISDELLLNLEDGLAGFARRGGRLGKYSCSLATAPEMIAFRTWAELWEDATPVPTVPVTFETPVTFRVGQVANPIPLPSSVFRSWRQRWDAFAPPDLATLVASNIAKEAVYVTYLNGQTTEYKMPGRITTGFVGEVHFHNYEEGPAGEQLSKQLNAMASIAPFAGTGTSTTTGLGVTSLLGKI